MISGNVLICTFPPNFPYVSFPLIVWDNSSHILLELQRWKETHLSLLMIRWQKIHNSKNRGRRVNSNLKNLITNFLTGWIIKGFMYIYLTQNWYVKNCNIFVNNKAVSRISENSSNLVGIILNCPIWCKKRDVPPPTLLPRLSASHKSSDSSAPLPPSHIVIIMLASTGKFRKWE